MMCISTIPAPIVDLNLRPLSWLWWIKLESVANDFFNKFAQGIKQNYQSERLRHIIGRFVGFRDYNGCWNLKIGQSMS